MLGLICTFDSHVCDGVATITGRGACYLRWCVYNASDCALCEAHACLNTPIAQRAPQRKPHVRRTSSPASLCSTPAAVASQHTYFTDHVCRISAHCMHCAVHMRFVAKRCRHVFGTLHLCWKYPSGSLNGPPRRSLHRATGNHRHGHRMSSLQQGHSWSLVTGPAGEASQPLMTYCYQMGASFEQASLHETSVHSLPRRCAAAAAVVGTTHAQKHKCNSSGDTCLTS